MFAVENRLLILKSFPGFERDLNTVFNGRVNDADGDTAVTSSENTSPENEVSKLTEGFFLTAVSNVNYVISVFIS